MLPMLRKGNYVPSIFDDFFNTDIARDFFNNERSTPAVNVSEDNDKFSIEVAAPGLDKKDFKVNIENNVLTISSEKQEKDEDKGKNFMRREFSYTSFSRSFTLPDNVEDDKIKATHKDGILNIEIPKSEEAKTKPGREIKIS